MRAGDLYFFAFLAFLLPYLFVWGRLLWFLSERSKLVRKIVISCMARSYDSYDVIKSKILGVAYFVYTIGGFVFMSTFWGRGFIKMFSVSGRTIPLAVLGFLTDIMMISLLLGAFLPVMRKRLSSRVTEEVGETPWIQGISNMEKKTLVVLFPGISGFFEELFFRGCLLYIFVETMHVNAFVAVIFVTLLFFIQQVLQLRSVGQIIIIGSSCIVISVVGSLLVLYTGGILPAAIAHALFAVFYVQWSKDVSK